MRTWVTRSAVLGSAGRVVGITVKVDASPALLIEGGETSWTPAGVARAAAWPGSCAASRTSAAACRFSDASCAFLAARACWSAARVAWAAARASLARWQAGVGGATRQTRRATRSRSRTLTLSRPPGR